MPTTPKMNAGLFRMGFPSSSRVFSRVLSRALSRAFLSFSLSCLREKEEKCSLGLDMWGFTYRRSNRLWGFHGRSSFVPPLPLRLQPAVGDDDHDHHHAGDDGDPAEAREEVLQPREDGEA